MSITPSERQQLLVDLNTLAVRDLVQLWRRAVIADVDLAAFIQDAFPDVAQAYSGVAADMAVEWYEVGAPDLTYRATPASPPPAVALRDSAAWALGATGETALDRMAGTLQRAVFAGARETIMQNAAAEPGARWARHASANACAFCRMMAIRSLDNTFYGSRAQAQRRGRGQTEDKYHDFCHCSPIEIRSGQTYTPPPYVEEWNEQYKTARKEAESGDPSQILSAWRQQGEHVH